MGLVLLVWNWNFQLIHGVGFFLNSWVLRWLDCWKKGKETGHFYLQHPDLFLNTILL